jgi:hypothetical protein
MTQTCVSSLLHLGISLTKASVPSQMIISSQRINSQRQEATPPSLDKAFDLKQACVHRCVCQPQLRHCFGHSQSRKQRDMISADRHISPKEMPHVSSWLLLLLQAQCQASAPWMHIMIDRMLTSRLQRNQQQRMHTETVPPTPRGSLFHFQSHSMSTLGKTSDEFVCLLVS